MTTAQILSCAMCGAAGDVLDENDFCEPCRREFGMRELARAEAAEEILGGALNAALLHLHEDDVRRLIEEVIANPFADGSERAGPGGSRYLLADLRQREHQMLAARISARKGS